MEISLVYNDKLVAKIGFQELKQLVAKYNRKLPYKVVLHTSSQEDIRKMDRLGVKYVLDWTGAWC